MVGNSRMLLPSELQTIIINIKNLNIVFKEYVFSAVFAQARPLKSLHCETAFTQNVHLFTHLPEHSVLY